MRFSFTIPTQPRAFKTGSAQNLRRKLISLSSYGYQAVELAVGDPQYIKVKELTDLLNDTGLKLSAIGTGQAYLEEGLSLASPIKKICRKAIERMKAQIDFAALFESVVIVGLIRGGASKGEGCTREALVKNLRTLCEYARRNKVKLVIEPINRYETAFIHTAEEAISLMQDVGPKAFYLMLDTFHMNIEEGDFSKAIRQAGPHLIHFHVADSDRWYPQHGHIDFDGILRDLHRVKYQGYISGEMMELPSFEVAARKTLQRLSKNIKKAV